MNIARRPLLIGAAAAAMLGGTKRANAAPVVTVPIRLTDDRVLIEATFGGGRAFLLALDTGGQMGLINTGIAETLNLTKVGARRLKLSFGHTDYPIFQAKNVMLGERLRLETLEMGGIDRDLGDGAIGSLPAWVLTLADGEVDFDAGVWRAHGAGLPALSGATRFDKGIVQKGATADKKFLFADAALNGRSFRFGLDTGMPSVMRIYRKTAEAAGLWNAPRWSPAAPQGKTRMVRVDRLELAGATVEGAVIQMRDAVDWEEFDTGIIGLPILRLFNIATSNRDGALFLTRNRQAPQLARYNRAGLWVDRAGSGMVAGVVGAGSPAEKAGIKAGDRLSGMRFEELIRQTSGQVGTVLPLTVGQGGAARQVSLVLADYL
jgi:predicted aspartyl protease